MAEIDVTHDKVIDRDLVVEQTGFRLSWGAIFAGFVIATVLQMALSLLGVGLGFLGWDPGDPLSNLGIGAGIWFALTAIITMFIGAMTTGRLAGVLTRGDGALHGVVMWALSTLLAIYLVYSGATYVLGGVFGFLGNAVTSTVGAVATGATQAGVAAAGQAGNLDLNAIQREIEATLRQTGDPALQPDSLQTQIEQARPDVSSGASNEALAQDIAGQIQRTAGNVDRQDLINVITARTNLSQAEAESLAGRIETAAGQAQTQVAGAVEDVQAGAADAASAAGDALQKGAWLALLTMGLSVAAAAWGAAMTARE